MALVEGTDTYADVTFADAYLASRINVQGSWATLTTPQKESALSLAMLHLDYLYSYRGQLTDETQPVNWPRTNVRDDQGREYDEDTIPDGVKKAQCELAVLWATNDQMTPPAEFFTKDDAASFNQLQMEKLGELQRMYFKNDQYIWELQQGYLKQKVYPMLDMMMKPFISRSPSDIFAEVLLY